MNVFHKVTLAALRKNRMRTIVTIIGIVLSASLMTAVTTSVSSLHNFLVQNVICESGKWHGNAVDVLPENYMSLSQNQEISESAYAEHLGYAWANSENTFKPYLYVLGISDNFTEVVSVHVTAGELPSRPDDILLPEHLAANGGVYYSIGDEITLDIGERMLDGFSLGQYQPYYSYSYENDPNGETILNDEEIVIRETRTFTVCGFYERPAFEEYSAPGYTCLTLPENSGNPLDMFFTLRHPSRVYDFMNENNLGGVYNKDLLRLIGVSLNDNYLTVVYGMAAILIGLIMFGSISLIYNAFAISVSERTKQFGLLSSVGATRKQLRRMVRFEALCVSAVGIPVGILVGIVGITITFLAIGEKFVPLMDAPTPMRMHVSVPAVVISLAVSLLTVLISAWIPSRRGAKVSAVEAIRQSSDIKEEKRPIRTPKWIYKAFGLSGMLAQKYFRRNRKKYRAVILSLFMSVVLFISASAFTDYLTESVVGVFDEIGWDIRYYCSLHEMAGMQPDELTELFRADANVDEAVCQITCNGRGGTDRVYLSEDGLAEYEQYTPNEYSEGRELGSFVTVSFISDDAYRALLEEYGLSESEFMNPAHPLGVACDNLTFFDNDAEKYRTAHYLASDVFETDTLFWKEIEGYTFDSMGTSIDDSGKEIETVSYKSGSGSYIYLNREEARVRVTFRTGKTIHEMPYYVMNTNYPTLLYPISMMDSMLAGVSLSTSANYLMKAEQHTAAVASLEKIISEHHLADNLYDAAAEQENERNLVAIVKVFSSGFIVLISLIAAANVFNSISTNIALRRREFAMLKSVGMTGKDLQQMMNFECILYGVRSLLFGLPVSIGVTVLIFMVVHEGYEAGFHIPWDAVGIAVLSVFTVVFASMLYAMQKIRKDNPIDALKNENL